MCEHRMMYMPMLHRQLHQIRAQLGAKEMKVSDALLLVMRCLRGKVVGQRLIWLNRELLGYHHDDLSLFERSKFSSISSFFSGNRKTELAVPSYRFLLGSWGRLDREGRLLCTHERRLMEKAIFCNIGIQQIETHFDEMTDANGSLFSMSADKASGAEFYCWSKELTRVYEAVRVKLCDFIDSVIEDLNLAPNGR